MDIGLDVDSSAEMVVDAFKLEPKRIDELNYQMHYICINSRNIVDFLVNVCDLAQTPNELVFMVYMTGKQAAV